jgi:hypothetical protein
VASEPYVDENDFGDVVVGADAGGGERCLMGGNGGDALYVDVE